MKKFIIPLVALVLVAAMLCAIPLKTTAENSLPENAIPDIGYLQGEFKEQLKQEIIAELQAGGGIGNASPYSDISATEGQLIFLSANSELIYRGGGAVAITSSNQKGEGISDMSEGTEIYSGQPLEYGHIYYSSETDSKKAVLVTGATAYFTVRGSYEIG